VHSVSSTKKAKQKISSEQMKNLDKSFSDDGHKEVNKKTHNNEKKQI